MTKPTGRPRGRPKTKEYVTLMARVPQELADRVQRYAGLHQQTLSLVLRDALEVLLEADRYQPFLSDTNAVRDIMSDRNADDTPIVSDRKAANSDMLSDTKSAMDDIVSDTNTEGLENQAGTPSPARSAKVSDTNTDTSPIMSDMKADAPPIMSDMKADYPAPTAETPAPAILSDTNMPAFDTSKFSLGKLCPRGHAHGTTGQSLLRLSNRHCLLCDREKWHEKYSPRRQA